MKTEVSVSTKQIPELKETIEFICADINAMKPRLKQAGKCAEEHERRLTLLEGYSGIEEFRGFKRNMEKMFITRS